MIGIKHDEALIAAAAAHGMSVDTLAQTIVDAISLNDGSVDDYAGESLGRLLAEQQWRLSLLEARFFNIPVLAHLTLLYKGAEIPCKRCGWDMAPIEEKDFIIGYKCPHCGYSQLDLPDDE